MWAAPLLVGASLLAFAGAAKAVRPAGTALALREAGLPTPPGVVRALAAAEAALGAGAAVLGGPVLAGAVSASYAVFALFVLVALARGRPLSSCGCFGESESPPTVSHVVIDVALAATALAAARAGGAGPLTLAARRPGWGAGVVAVSGVTAGLVFLVMARLPRLRLAVAERP